MNSTTTSSSLNSEDREEARKDIAEAMEACYASPPTAGAVVIVTTEHGIQFFKLNLSVEDSAHLLLGVSALLDTSTSTHDVPELLQ